jgi:hypothetical protein
MTFFSTNFDTTDNAINLCKNYLTNRKQYIILNDTTSHHLNINTGVLQGSILRPFLFLIYINDLPNSSTFFNFITYADDTTLLTTLNPQHHSNNINNELNKIHQWFCTNKLSLNASKTKAITFHTPQRKITPQTLLINSEQIENVDCTNFLGIIIDKNLNFKHHICKISTKISQITGILNKLKNTLPHHILRTIYNSLILPHLTYGALTWSRGPQINSLIKMQKKVIRIITNSSYRTSF